MDHCIFFDSHYKNKMKENLKGLSCFEMFVISCVLEIYWSGDVINPFKGKITNQYILLIQTYSLIITCIYF